MVQLTKKQVAININKAWPIGKRQANVQHENI